MGPGRVSEGRFDQTPCWLSTYKATHYAVAIYLHVSYWTTQTVPEWGPNGQPSAPSPLPTHAQLNRLSI